MLIPIWNSETQNIKPKNQTRNQQQTTKSTQKHNKKMKLYPQPSAPLLDLNFGNNENYNIPQQSSLSEYEYQKQEQQPLVTNENLPSEFQNIDTSKFHLHKLDRFHDSLTSLAILYHVQEEDIKRLNRFTDLDLYMKPYLINQRMSVNALLTEYKQETLSVEQQLSREQDKQRRLTTVFSRVHQTATLEEARYYLSYNDWDLERAKNHLMEDREWENQQQTKQESHQRWLNEPNSGSSSSGSGYYPRSSTSSGVPLLSGSGNLVKRGVRRMDEHENATVTLREGHHHVL